MLNTSLTDRIRQLLPRTRITTSLQLALLASGEASASAVREGERILNNLCRAGWARRTRVFARPVPDLSGGPLYCWKPGDPRLSNVGHILWRASSRWTEPPRMQTVWHAGKRLLSHLGQTGDGRIRQPGQATHDLSVTQILVELVASQQRCKDAAAWIGEEQLGKRFLQGKVPDAIIAHPQKIPLAIDFLGNYPADRIERIIRFYSQLGLPFELW